MTSTLGTPVAQQGVWGEHMWRGGCLLINKCHRKTPFLLPLILMSLEHISVSLHFLVLCLLGHIRSNGSGFSHYSHHKWISPPLLLVSQHGHSLGRKSAQSQVIANYRCASRIQGKEGSVSYCMANTRNSHRSTHSSSSTILLTSNTPRDSVKLITFGLLLAGNSLYLINHMQNTLNLLA